MDKPMTFNEWMGKQGNLALVHANCCRIAYEAGQQSQQAKVEELQTHAQEIHKREIKLFEKTLILTHECDELQKRVDSLEKVEFKLAQVKAILQNNPKLLESILIKKIEQALKGEKS
ncbi:hypothetical protein [Acinetobacter nosocomialis]|uniref:hypothetical protein n=1 Tax=Acinetobacter nosocomialis TaxID=106654 RepID=UPI00125DE8A6|nr:hypothetical protein [Acinetobacter nosocomialis]